MRRPHSNYSPAQSLCPKCSNYLHTESLRVSTDKGRTWKVEVTTRCLKRRGGEPSARCCGKRTTTIPAVADTGGRAPGMPPTHHGRGPRFLLRVEREF